MESILKRCEEDPMKMTYLGIGSAPHVSEPSQLSQKEDQLIPLCFHELMKKEKMPIRILHFDPWFEKLQGFLTVYFERWDLVPVEFPGGMCWMGDGMEVILISSCVDHKEDLWFFETLCQTILGKKGKLVIQEFTGYSLEKLREALLASAPQKELFKRRVLIDMTYGTDLNCSTDMSKARPFYDYDGNFLNLHFLSATDALRWVGISTKVDEILKQKYIGQFLQILNNMHVDYRRRLKQDPVLFGSDLYTTDASPDEIMRALQTTLTPIFEILTKLRVVGSEENERKESLFLLYKSHDPYKWYDAMRKLISF